MAKQMFSKRHYEAIAESIAKAEAYAIAKNYHDVVGVSFVAQHLALMFAHDNPDFDVVRFLDACQASPQRIGAVNRMKRGKIGRERVDFGRFRDVSV